MLARLSLTAKATLFAGLCSTGAALSVLWLLGRVPTWLAVALPFAVCTGIASVFTWYVTRVRLRALIDSCRRIAAGDLRAEPGPPPDADLGVVRAAIIAMGQALDEMTARLQRVDAERRRLFSDLAHELAQPISTVLGIADALAEPERFGAARERLLEHLRVEAARLERLASDLRDLALLDDPETRLEPADTDVAALAASAAERAQVTAGARVTVACRAEAARARVDPVRIDQVLTNLLSNAVRHTPDGGRVELACASAAGEIELAVEDSGAGVPEDVLPRLGERLLRLDPSRNRKTGGHGLGLSIVAAVVSRHRGRLRFERARLGGLRVVVRLPAIAAA